MDGKVTATLPGIAEGVVTDVAEISTDTFGRDEVVTRVDKRSGGGA
jgi:hypothetical protein